MYQFRSASNDLNKVQFFLLNYIHVGVDISVA